jgi:hypothetical protein
MFTLRQMKYRKQNEFRAYYEVYQGFNEKTNKLLTPVRRIRVEPSKQIG